MMMNPAIILQGQQPDMVNALRLGTQAAGESVALQRQNALAGVYRDHGAGIVGGDETAINALAALDPMAAMKVQTTRQEADMARQRMDILTAQERRAAEEYARGLTAQQRAAEAQQIEDAVKMGMGIADPATWDATMATMAPELVGRFGERDALARRFMSWAEIVKGMEGPTPLSSEGKLYADERAGLVPPGTAGRPGFRQATPEEASSFGAAAGQFGPDGRFYPINPPSGGIEMIGPDGTVMRVGGPAGGGPKLTEQQTKDLVYWQRATGASDAVDANENAIANFGDSLMSGVPLVGNYLVSEEFQAGKQAADEWLSAILRKDTGAAITDQEFTIYGRVYFPLPGDSPAVIQQKREARKRAEEGIRLGLGTADILAREVEARRAAADGTAGISATVGSGGGGSVGAPTAEVASPEPTSGLSPGHVEDGYIYLGGAPDDPASWVKVRE